MNFHTYCRDLNIKPGFFDPNDESEFYISNDLEICINEVKNSLGKSLSLSITGQNGIGKTTIKYYLTQYTEFDNVRFLRTHHLDESYRIEDIYTAITLSIDENAKITRKLSNRKKQAHELLSNNSKRRNLFIIDNGELIKNEVLSALLKFKKNLRFDFSVLVFSQKKHDIKFDKNITLQDLSEKEIIEYFMLLRKKVENKLPHMISLNSIKNSKTYYEIIESALKHSWERKVVNEHSKS